MTSHCELCWIKSWIKTLPTDTHLSLDELMDLLPTKPLKRTTVCPEDGHSHDCAKEPYMCHEAVGPCPHSRPSWHMCPHCNGINSEWPWANGVTPGIGSGLEPERDEHSNVTFPKSWLPADWRMGYFVAHVVGVGLRLHRSLAECDCIGSTTVTLHRDREAGFGNSFQWRECGGTNDPRPQDCPNMEHATFQRATPNAIAQTLWVYAQRTDV